MQTADAPRAPSSLGTTTEQILYRGSEINLQPALLHFSKQFCLCRESQSHSWVEALQVPPLTSYWEHLQVSQGQFFYFWFHPSNQGSLAPSMRFCISPLPLTSQALLSINPICPPSQDTGDLTNTDKMIHISDKNGCKARRDLKEKYYPS